MQVDEGSTVSGGEIKLLSCQSLPSSSASTVSNSTRASCSNGLCYLALHWTGNVYVVIFDLNQWYQAQMPSRWLFDDMANLCPFMGFYHVRMGNEYARQVWIQPETLSIFHRSSVSTAEQFFYPSALSFRMVTVSPFQTESILFLGIQSLLLHKLGKSGSSVLSQPHRHYIQVRRNSATANARDKKKMKKLKDPKNKEKKRIGESIIFKQFGWLQKLF